MDYFIKSQIKNMTSIAEAFVNACRIAAQKNDGLIDKDETKALKKIEAATQRFIKEINAVIKE